MNHDVEHNDLRDLSGLALGLIVGLLCAFGLMVGVAEDPIAGLVVGTVMGGASFVKPPTMLRLVPWLLRGSAAIVAVVAVVRLML